MKKERPDEKRPCPPGTDTPRASPIIKPNTKPVMEIKISTGFCNNVSFLRFRLGPRGIVGGQYLLRGNVPRIGKTSGYVCTCTAQVVERAKRMKGVLCEASRNKI